MQKQRISKRLWGGCPSKPLRSAFHAQWFAQRVRLRIRPTGAHVRCQGYFPYADGAFHTGGLTRSGHRRDLILLTVYTDAMITGVLFDLDETLLDRTGSLREFLSYQHARHPALAKTVFEHFLDRFMTLDNRGRTMKPAVYSKLLEEFGIVGQRFARTLFNEYECEFWRFAEGFSGLDQLFKNLKKKGIRTGIVTNGQTHIQSRSIAALKLDSRVDAVLISESEGLRKPEIEIFLRATTMIGLRPADCMFVGDSPLTDIVGAQRAGLKAIWFANGAEWPRDVASCPDAEIGSLDEILEVIDHFRE